MLALTIWVQPPRRVDSVKDIVTIYDTHGRCFLDEK